MESPVRSIVKAITWRAIATAITFCIALFLLKDLSKALSIGILDTLIKIGAYYGHERIWDRIAIGRPKEPEYYL